MKKETKTKLLQKLVDEVERRMIDCVIDDMGFYNMRDLKQKLKMIKKEKHYDSVETFKAYKKLINP